MAPLRWDHTARCPLVSGCLRQLLEASHSGLGYYLSIMGEAMYVRSGMFCPVGVQTCWGTRFFALLGLGPVEPWQNFPLQLRTVEAWRGVVLRLQSLTVIFVIFTLVYFCLFLLFLA